MKRILIGLLIYLSLLAAVLLVGYFCLINSRWLFSSDHDNFAGSFVGGVIGGIVAYLVAQYQISAANKNELKREVKQKKAFITSLKFELESNKDYLETIKASSSNNGVLTFRNNPFKSDVWDVIKLNIGLVDCFSENEYRQIASLYNVQFALALQVGQPISPKALSEYESHLKDCTKLLKNLEGLK